MPGHSRPARAVPPYSCCQVGGKARARGKVKAGARVPSTLLCWDGRMEKLFPSRSARHGALARTGSLPGTGSSPRAPLPSSNFQAPEKPLLLQKSVLLSPLD